VLNFEIEMVLVEICFNFFFLLSFVIDIFLYFPVFEA
jgi:hypothetical protein